MSELKNSEAWVFITHVYVASKGKLFVVGRNTQEQSIRICVNPWYEKHLLLFDKNPEADLDELVSDLKDRHFNSQFGAKLVRLKPDQGQYDDNLPERYVVEVTTPYAGLKWRLKKQFEAGVWVGGGCKFKVWYLHDSDTPEGKYLGESRMRVGQWGYYPLTSRKPLLKFHGGNFDVNFEAPFTVTTTPPEWLPKLTVADLPYAFVHCTAVPCNDGTVPQAGVDGVAAIQMALVKQSEVQFLEFHSVSEARQTVLEFRPTVLAYCTDPLPARWDKKNNLCTRPVPNPLEYLCKELELQGVYGLGPHTEGVRICRPWCYALGIPTVDLAEYLKQEKWYQQTRPELVKRSPGLTPPSATKTSEEWLELAAALQYFQKNQTLHLLAAMARLFVYTLEAGNKGVAARVALKVHRVLNELGWYKSPEPRFPLVRKLSEQYAPLEAKGTTKGYEGAYNFACPGVYGSLKLGPGNEDQGNDTRTSKRGKLDPEQSSTYEFILSLDFAAMYPNIILVLQLCLSRFYCGTEQGLQKIEASSGTVVQWVKVNRNACAAIIVKQDGQETPTLLLRLVQECLELRCEFRAHLKKLDASSQEYAVYNNLQLVAKLLANSVYGLLGQATSILAHVNCASAVTTQGRDDIRKARDIVNTQWNVPSTPLGQLLAQEVDANILELSGIFIDTDSVYSKCSFECCGRGVDVAVAIGKVLERVLNTHYFEAPSRMEFEAVYNNLTIFKKKTNCGTEFPPQVGVTLNEAKHHSKGLPSKKRSFCPLNADANLEVEKCISASTTTLEAQVVEVVQKTVLLWRTVRDGPSTHQALTLARNYKDPEANVGPTLRDRYYKLYNFLPVPNTRMVYCVYEPESDRQKLLAQRVGFPGETGRLLDKTYYLKQLKGSLLQTLAQHPELKSKVAAILTRAIHETENEQANRRGTLSKFLQPVVSVRPVAGTNSSQRPAIFSNNLSSFLKTVHPSGRS